MKEALSPNDPFMLMLENAFQQCKIKNIDRVIRRGYPPRYHAKIKQAQMEVFNEKQDQSRWEESKIVRGVYKVTEDEKVEYPFTALGTVWIQRQEKAEMLGTAAIIGENYIMTARFPQLSLKNQIFFVPFSSKNGERYKVEGIFPNIYTKDIQSEQEVPQNIAVLEVTKNSDLQEKYGSFGYHFGANDKQNKFTCFFFAGVSSVQQGRNIVCVRETHLLRSIKNQISYNLDRDIPLITGSPILYKKNGQFMICGIHLGKEQEQKVLKGTLLTKEMYDKLSKFTSQKFSVDLSHSILNEKGLKVLQKSSLKKVVSLDLEDTYLLQGCKILGSSNLNKLKQLNISSNRLTDDHIHYVALTPWKDLNYFYASSNRLTSIGIKQLTRGQWKNLIHLHLNNNAIGSRGMAHFIRNNWILMEQLNLQNTEFDNECCEKLRKCYFPNLKGLSLSFFCDNQGKNRIGESGMKWLTKGDWKLLEFIDLSRNHLRQSGVKRLVSCNWSKYGNFYVGFYSSIKALITYCGSWAQRRNQRPNLRMFRFDTIDY